MTFTEPAEYGDSSLGEAQRLFKALLDPEKGGFEIAEDRSFQQIVRTATQAKKGFLEGLLRGIDVSPCATRIPDVTPRPGSKIFDSFLAIKRRVQVLRDFERKVEKLLCLRDVDEGLLPPCLYEELEESPGLKAGAVAQEQVASTWRESDETR